MMSSPAWFPLTGLWGWKVCKCNQGGRVLGIVKSPRITMVRKLLMRARLLKQEYEVTKDFYKNGGPEYLKPKCELLYNDAKFARETARGIMVQMEIAAGRAFMQGRPYRPTSANLVQGSNFKNWAEYHETFVSAYKSKPDIWR